MSNNNINFQGSNSFANGAFGFGQANRNILNGGGPNQQPQNRPPFPTSSVNQPSFPSGGIAPNSLHRSSSYGAASSPHGGSGGFVQSAPRPRPPPPPPSNHHSTSSGRPNNPPPNPQGPPRVRPHSSVASQSHQRVSNQTGASRNRTSSTNVQTIFRLIVFQTIQVIQTFQSSPSHTSIDPLNSSLKVSITSSSSSSSSSSPSSSFENKQKSNHLIHHHQSNHLHLHHHHNSSIENLNSKSLKFKVILSMYNTIIYQVFKSSQSSQPSQSFIPCL